MSDGKSQTTAESEIGRLAGQLAARFQAFGHDDRAEIKAMLMEFAAEIRRS